MKRRTIRRTTAALVLLALPLMLLLLLEADRADPGRVPQTYWYRMGTRSAGHRFEPLPRQHHVTIEPVGSSIARHVADNFGQARGWVAERGGRFDQETGGIEILGKQARLEAELTVPWRPALGNVMRHEYGHALLYDWLHALTDAESADALFLGAATPRPNADAFPEPIRPVMSEFATTRTDIYGSTYYTSTFDEYLAESYARYLAGKHVGAEVARFLRAVEESGAAVR